MIVKKKERKLCLCFLVKGRGNCRHICMNLPQASDVWSTGGWSELSHAFSLAYTLAHRSGQIGKQEFLTQPSRIVRRGCPRSQGVGYKTNLGQGLPCRLATVDIISVVYGAVYCGRRRQRHGWSRPLATTPRIRGARKQRRGIRSIPLVCTICA